MQNLQCERHFYFKHWEQWDRSQDVAKTGQARKCLQLSPSGDPQQHDGHLIRFLSAQGTTCPHLNIWTTIPEVRLQNQPGLATSRPPDEHRRKTSLPRTRKDQQPSCPCVLSELYPPRGCLMRELLSPPTCPPQHVLMPQGTEEMRPRWHQVRRQPNPTAGDPSQPLAPPPPAGPRPFFRGLWGEGGLSDSGREEHWCLKRLSCRLHLLFGTIY